MIASPSSLEIFFVLSLYLTINQSINQSSMSMASSSSSNNETLIPGLPDDISSTILSSLPLPHHSRLKLTSRSWRSFFSDSPSLLLLRRRLRLRSHLLCLFPSDPSLSPPLLFDPASLLWWAPLPPLPVSTHRFSLSNFTPVFLFPHLYLLGGSHFDARSYPLNHPLPSSAAHRIDLSAPAAWSRLPPMRSARGSFACAADEATGTVLVAGGGSRHRMYPSEGSRIGNVEVLDAGTGEWRVGEGMGRCRAGCVGFVRGGEFWVMGGYGEYTTVSGVVPRDVYCRDAVAMGLRSGKWREVGNMWEEGERRRLGKVGVVEGEEDEVEVFMLDRNEIFRYDFAKNQWPKETSLRRKVPLDESCCFVAMNGELYVMTSGPRAPPKKRPSLEMQVYNPKKRKWRFLTTTMPFHHALDFKTAVSCTIQL